ncbi:MAG TPA: phage terminase small subunit P27 family [Pirellulaceae bacterium]|nr:phage terminase small subunit P27 family [Pirellulaceae bacterium]
MKGRKPKPTLLKLLDGNPGKRPLNEREPVALQGLPAPPQWLDAEAKAEWERIIPDLAEMGVLSRADRPALAAYCTAWSRWVEAEGMVKKFGMIVKSPEKGFPMKSPYLSIADQALETSQNRPLPSFFTWTPVFAVLVVLGAAFFAFAAFVVVFFLDMVELL